MHCPGNVHRAMLFIAALTSLLFVSQEDAASERSAVSVFEKSVPENPTDLREIERTVREIADRVIPCTVGIQVGMAQGSGVIISDDGYVLTAAHVAGWPRLDAIVKLPDGKTFKAKTLGMNTECDGALIKITEEGEWPFAAIVPPDEYPQLGDWCVATGHPGGFQSDRTPPVRLGRIIDVDPYTLRTDCVLNSGDSGGPLFDVQGRVIGIHSRISEQATFNLHGPALAYVECWDEMKSGRIYPPVPPSQFLSPLDIDNDGRIHRDELPPDYLRVFDRLLAKFELDPTKSYTLDELKDMLGWIDAPGELNIRPFPGDRRPGQTLKQDRLVRGQRVRAAFDSLVAGASKSTVEVFCKGDQVALGTVVGTNGWVVTKASQLTATDVTGRTQNGKSMEGRVVRVEPEYDLAILQFDATDLTPVTWADATDLKPGSWLATPGRSGKAISVGVVSVAEREIAGTPGVLGVEIDPQNESKGAAVASVFSDSGAARAGIRADDIITRIMDVGVGNLQELRDAVQKFRAGETIRATVQRDDDELQLDVKLGMPQDVFRDSGQNQLEGPLNQRRDDFPAAIQHDSVLKPTECGGPVVDVDGHVIGVNVARAGRTMTYVVPSATIKPLIEDLVESKSDAG